MLAGVWVENVFHPAVPGVEPIRGRLPQPGLVGWVDLPTPLIAAGLDQAGSAALEVARAAWPRSVQPAVPYASGVWESDLSGVRTTGS